MKRDNNRRDFLGKLALGMGSLVALPFSGLTRSKQNTMENKTATSPIINIKPLGFQWETADPFLFCVHHEDNFPEGNEEFGPNESLEGRQIGQDFIVKNGYRMYHGTKVPGFPGHPHRGFETITVVRKGMVDHADSLGTAGRYGDGDVQWMTAGKGVQHSEMFPLLNRDKKNPLELFQIWINLPKKSKMVNPHYKMLWDNSIPRFTHLDKENRKTEIEIIAGSLEDHQAPSPPPNSWAADNDNAVGVFIINLDAGAEYTLTGTNTNSNRSIYFYEGNDVALASVTIPEYHGVTVKPDESIVLKNNGSRNAKFLVLQGKPILEPVVQHGPFVMNTREEIQQAFQDYHRTQFGGWPWDESGPVHDRSKGRFATYSDGSEENKS